MSNSEDQRDRGVLLAWRDPYRELAHTDPDSLRARVDRDMEVLRLLGAEGAGLGSGAQLFTPHEGRATCNVSGWNWLRPLLMELAEYREALAEGECLPSRWQEGETR